VNAGAWCGLLPTTRPGRAVRSGVEPELGVASLTSNLHALFEEALRIPGPLTLGRPSSFNRESTAAEWVLDARP